MAENRGTNEDQVNEIGLPMDDFSVRKRNYTAPDPSPRNPRISRHNNADRIEQQMQADGHRTWGYAIYRTHMRVMPTGLSSSAVFASR
jgi:hypothetical protein